jgi:hypothetical protein
LATFDKISNAFLPAITLSAQIIVKTSHLAQTIFTQTLKEHNFRPIDSMGVPDSHHERVKKMSVTDFECAIAKSQIGRYIAGDNLAPEVARQLESHIDNCVRCKQLLQERKNTLEAMVSDDDEFGTRTKVSVKSDSIPMNAPITNGSSALKPDYMEVLADNARKSLREKLKDSPRIEAAAQVTVPAFAYQEAVPAETALASKATKKKGIGLSAFALFREVPEESYKPSLSPKSIRTAKAAFRSNNSDMKKPMMYLAGLCAVVAAMSFVLRDPTSLFGGRASEKAGMVATKPSGSKLDSKVAKKSTVKTAKVLPHKPTQLTDKGTDAQIFANGAQPKPKPKLKSKPILKATKKPKVVSKKTNKKAVIDAPTSHNAHRKVSKHVPIAPHVTVRHHATATIPKKRHKPTSDNNVVKLYTPDTTPQPQEQK